ncbi:unannotated protein [freshwater metagenome]|uniref:Unannotated protein n=1 Tax=freshwater metagenome TaxID=449393 RepID=A0A6J7EGF5_9ZZZZ|nr:hypothetical protein [Actinomycetota bacterium]
MRSLTRFGQHSGVPGALAVLAFVMLSACSGGDQAGPGSGGTESQPVTSTAGTVPLIQPGYERQAVLDALGEPDAFRLTVNDLDGVSVTQESLVYGELTARIDLVDGVVAGTETIDPYPTGTMYPHQYSSWELRGGMTAQEARSALEGVELVSMDGSAVGIPGGTWLAGNQLLLGFADNKLVYAETFPLTPDEAGTWLTEVQSGVAP